ncbi:MAG: neutral/alkaline non-lysosomal ceramidase N-terminal domain-containing protein [Acidobacteria bacterium]|nr:neutral/alkaline non-lysosomal ceramidase N-terminal domain-containing protein [Acidobacteriota bacterium]
MSSTPSTGLSPLRRFIPGLSGLALPVLLLATGMEAAPLRGCPATHPFLAGAASRVITPVVEGGVPPPRIAGFDEGRDATGVHDDLYARALVLQAGKELVAIVALDLIGFFHDDVVRVREEIRARYPEARAGQILVASTHTHAGPDVIGLWTPAGRPLDSGYVDRVRSASADAVADAWRRRRPARLSFASARLPGLVRDTRLPHVVDDRALLMKVESADGRETIATLLVFPSHPESLGRHNTLVSSDYPWAARLALEEAFGGLGIFLSGAIGGLLTPLRVAVADPRTGEPFPERSFRDAEALGRETARAAIAAWRAGGEAPGSATDAGRAPESVGRGAIAVHSRQIRVPLENPRFVRGLAEGRIRPRALADDGTLTSEVAVVTIRGPDPHGPGGAGGAGGLGISPPLAQFACVPGEIYPELVIGGIQDPQDPGADFPGAAAERPLESLMTAPHKFVLGLCNDELGYIIPMSQWDEKPPFAYGRDRAQYGEINSAGPRVAPIVIDAFAGLLR